MPRCALTKWKWGIGPAVHKLLPGDLQLFDNARGQLSHSGGVKSLRLIPALLAANALAQETPVTPKIESVGLFKNGLCVVHSSFEAKGAGTFVWSDPPRCVHGTFLVESESGGIALSSRMQTVEEVIERDRPSGVFQTDLAGQEVKIRLRGAQAAGQPEIVGRVWQMPSAARRSLLPSNSLAGDTPNYNELRAANAAMVESPITTGRYLVIEQDQKRLYLDTNEIISLEVAGPGPERKRSVEKSQMLFNTTKAGTVRVSYLTRGASWVPSYHVNLSDPKKLRISQSALIRNEVAPWKKAQVQLISGFPNVRFSHVDSPLWPGTTLASFFSQVGANARAGSGAVTQQVLYNRMGESRAPELPTDGGQSEDLHFESIGERDVAQGETMSLEVANGTADYERVVEWSSPDSRREDGQYNRTDSTPKDDEQPWDAVVFQNPLKFPMTTAAATVTENGQFRGQSQSEWTNPGQRSCLKVTRALSIQADRQEVEDQTKREEIYILGVRHYRATVKGTLTMRNFRSQPAVMLTRAQFSGELSSADENPSKTLRKEGVFSVNPRHELEWKLTLPAGAEKVLNYRYSVLVRW